MSVRYFSGRRIGAALVAALLTGSVLATTVEARPGDRGSVGSRGTRTYSKPPTTNTAPGETNKVDRSTTAQPGQARVPGTIRPAAAPNVAAAAPKRGFGGLIMGGLLGAGLFGLLSGAGLFGGLSGFGGFIGLLLQIALIGGIVWLAMRFFRNRQQPAMAGAQSSPMGRPMAAAVGPMAAPVQRTGLNANAGSAPPPLQISADDFNAFEALLGKVQNAYGRDDRAALAGMVTPEMLSYFEEELVENARQGIRNEVAGGKLLQGDLSEAWSEGNTDYATVAMRYSITDAKIEMRSGRVVSGSRTEPEEVTEVWTFRRPRAASAANWRLSAIQQVQ